MKWIDSIVIELPKRIDIRLRQYLQDEDVPEYLKQFWRKGLYSDNEFIEEAKKAKCWLRSREK